MVKIKIYHFHKMLFKYPSWLRAQKLGKIAILCSALPYYIKVFEILSYNGLSNISQK